MRMTDKESMSEILLEALKRERILTRDGPLTQADVDAQIARLAGLGLKPRESVGLCFENGPECIAAYVALSCLNAVAVPQSPQIPDPIRRRLWRELGCRFAILQQDVAVLSEGNSVTAWPDEICFVVHSSGSEGLPKAIPLTLPAMRSNAWDTMRILGGETEILHLGSMSQCYTNGLFNSFILPLLTGGKVLVGPLASAFNIRSLVRLIRDVRPDLLWVNPTVLSLLRRVAESSDLDSVKWMVSCTAPLQLPDCLEAERAFQKPVLQSYGLSETLIVSVEHPRRNARTEFSAGLPVGGRESVGVNADGTLVIRNGAVFPGYVKLQNSRLTFEGIRGDPEPAFVTGDTGRIDPSGRLLITGRSAGVINVAGTKFGVEQIESILSEWPSVTAAAVIRVEDKNGVERPAALIQTDGTAVDSLALENKCAETLGPHARPLAIYVVSEIPLTSNGKIDRRSAAALFQTLHQTAFSSENRARNVSASRSGPPTLIAGLSHIFGETEVLEDQTRFWMKAGMNVDLRYTLDVPNEKRETLLLDQKVSRVDLCSLSFPDHAASGPAIEFISHGPRRARIPPEMNRPSAIRLLLKGTACGRVSDLDGNQMVMDERFSGPATILVSTPDPQAAGEILSSLGFRPEKMIDPRLAAMLDRLAASAAAWIIQLPLFPKLAARIVLTRDPACPANPKIDRIGWNGLSFLVSGFSKIEKILPLRARQAFQTDPQTKKEIAFFSGSGLLFEFLHMTRR